MPSPIPVILCGKTPQIATGVKAGLQPHYEGATFIYPDSSPFPLRFSPAVIHVILSPAEGTSIIPALLRGETPPTSDSTNIGTQDYTNKAVAVVTGGGYDDAAVSEMREACKGASTVPWLRPDLSKPTPPLGPEYGKHMVERVKTCLRKLAEEEKMQSDGIHFY